MLPETSPRITATKSPRIIALKRYISLLQTEEKHLKWITSSTSATKVVSIDSAAKLKVVTEKLARAERELSDLELGSGN
jgi:hypothetical protein